LTPKRRSTTTKAGGDVRKARVDQNLWPSAVVTRTT
jgi:hypothetical protein